LTGKLTKNCHVCERKF